MNYENMKCNIDVIKCFLQYRNENYMKKLQYLKCKSDTFITNTFSIILKN